MAIRWDKFTIKAQEAIQHASELASQHGNPEILPLHLLAALIQDQEGIIVPLLTRVGANPPTVETQVMERINQLPKVSGGGIAQAHLSAGAQKTLDQAFKEADKFKDEYVSTEHLLLAIAGDKDKNNEAAQLLKTAGANYDAILKALTAVRGSQRVTDQNPEGKYQALERYAKDLTELARRGKLDPVIGRDDEIRRVVQVLSRRARRGQDGDCGRPGPAHHFRRRAGDPQEQARRRPGSGLHAGRGQISRRV